jgi:hypothetical protein
VSIYTYSQSNVIDEVTFKRTANDSIRAYLHLSDKADPAKAQEILGALRTHNCACTPFMHDDKSLLEVRGFSKEEELLDRVRQWTSGPAEKTLEAEDKISTWERFKKRTLQLSGLSYMVGDYGFVRYGLKEADNLVVAAAISYFLGTLSLVFYGRNDQSDLQIKDLSNDVAGFAKKNNIAIPENSALHDITQDRPQSTLQAANEFCKRYPSEIFNTVTAIAGVFVAASAYKNKVMRPTAGLDAKAIHEMKIEGWMDFGLGSITALSGTFATLVKEKKPDPDSPPKGMLDSVWQKIQAHPLAIAGGGYSIATMCHAASTWKAYKEAKRVNDVARLESVPNRAIFVGAALLSEALLAISSKGHGEGVVSDHSVDNSTIAIVSDMIVKQPLAKQEQLIQAMGDFLGESKQLAMKNDEVVAQVRTQVEKMRKNPWAVHLQAQVDSQPNDEHVKDAAPAKQFAAERAATTDKDWQTKVGTAADKHAAPAHLSF